MAVIGGKESPSEVDIKTILEAAGCEIDQKMLKEGMTRMDGKVAHELIKEGYGKFAACGGGGGGGGGGAVAAGGGAGGDAAGAGEAKKEEKKVEEEEEEEDMDFDLFG